MLITRAADKWFKKMNYLAILGLEAHPRVEYFDARMGFFKFFRTNSRCLMQIISATLHRVDHASNVVTAISISNQTTAVKAYISDLIEKITLNTTGRKFEFGSSTTEVHAQINQMVTLQDFQTAADVNASRLLVQERIAQQQMNHLDIEIQKGILFQALVEDGTTKKVIISKAEHSDFLEDEQLVIKHGLPLKKKIYKAILVTFVEDRSTVLVYDTNAIISKYWWLSYLELSEIYTDTHNTTKAFEAIDRAVLSKIKKKHPADHNIIRNSIVRYFKTPHGFNMDHFIENVIGQYVPIDPALNTEQLKTKIRQLPEQKGFDTQFTILPEVITAKQLRNIIALTDKIDLNIKEDVADINEIIKPVIENGQKYIKIKTDTGYEAFKANQ